MHNPQKNALELEASKIKEAVKIETDLIVKKGAKLTCLSKMNIDSLYARAGSQLEVPNVMDNDGNPLVKIQNLFIEKGATVKIGDINIYVGSSPYIAGDVVAGDVSPELSAGDDVPA